MPVEQSACTDLRSNVGVVEVGLNAFIFLVWSMSSENDLSEGCCRTLHVAKRDNNQKYNTCVPE